MTASCQGSQRSSTPCIRSRSEDLSGKACRCRWDVYIAHLLWAFDVEAIQGEEVDPWAMVVVGFMTEPKPFKFRSKPRGQWVLDVVRREWGSTEKSLDRVMGIVNDSGEVVIIHHHFAQSLRF
jgi:hypothetical protein